MVSSELAVDSEDGTYCPVILLCPVHEVDNARCAQAGGCQGQLRRARHGVYQSSKLASDDEENSNDEEKTAFWKPKMRDDIGLSIRR